MATNHANARGSTSGAGVPPPYADSTDGKIWAYHLLVKHDQSRRPSSWREVRQDLFSSPATANYLRRNNQRGYSLTGGASV